MTQRKKYCQLISCMPCARAMLICSITETKSGTVVIIGVTTCFDNPLPFTKAVQFLHKPNEWAQKCEGKLKHLCLFHIFVIVPRHVMLLWISSFIWLENCRPSVIFQSSSYWLHYLQLSIVPEWVIIAHSTLILTISPLYLLPQSSPLLVLFLPSIFLLYLSFFSLASLVFLRVSSLSYGTTIHLQVWCRIFVF